ncbi:MAG: hypothetical protein QW046_05760 [Candidatus Micrarchaeaceae archaeon]
MVQPLSYYQNQFFNNANNAIANVLIQLPVQIQGSLIAYDNVNDWFKISLDNSNITQNVNVVNALTITGTVNTQIVGSNITQNVTIVGPLDTSGNVKVDLMSSNITQNVAVVNTPNVNIAGSNITPNVTIVGPLDTSGNVKVDLMSSNITQNVAVVNTPNVNIAGSNITPNVTIVGPLDTLGNVKVDLMSSNITQNVAVVNTPNVNIVGGGFTSSVTIVGSNITQKVTIVGPLDASGNVNVNIAESSLTGTVDVTIIGSNITQSVSVVNTPNVNIAGSNITSNVTIVGPLDTSGNVKVDLMSSNITPNVSIVGVGYNQINLFSNAFITSSSTTIINTANYQDMVVDTVYGGVLTGAIYTSIYGVEPQSNILTSPIINGTTASSNTLTVQRLIANGPLGAKVAIVVNTAPSTQVTGVFITIEQSVMR